MKWFRQWSLPGAALLALVAFVGCAVNPATGKRQLVLMGEQQEIQLGLENDKAISAQLGLYDDSELQGYVQRLGGTLAAGSERPNLDWKFRVVDDPTVNAFALPGGFIYVTRGILAHMNNEAELVSVLGHEIGHVTARHGVNQMSKAQLFQLGLGAGMVFSEDVRQMGGLLQSGLSVLFLKYSRDDERQADDLGLRYLTLADYDPRSMPDMFDTLGRVGDAAGGGRAPGWLATHPSPGNRQARIGEMIAASGVNYDGRRINREGFLQKIDGIVFGSNPREGYTKDGVFKHPELKFRLTFPSSWKSQNQKQAVLAISAEEDAIVQLTLASEATGPEALRKFVDQEGVEAGKTWRRQIGGLAADSRYFRVPREQGTIVGLVAFVTLDDRVYSLLGYTGEEQWAGRQSAIESCLESFGRLTDRAALDVQPHRLRLVRADSAMSLSSFASRHGASVPVETLALINRLDPGERLRAGQTYKVVVGKEFP